MKKRVYVQSEAFADIKLVEIDDSSSIENLRQECLALIASGFDSSEFELFIEGEEEDSNPTHVHQLNKEHGIRVHLHRCKRIFVRVHFGAQLIERKFQPAMTIGRIRKWVGKELGMQQSDIAEHVLQVHGTTEQPDMDIHIGTLATCPACSVEFDFVPAHRING